MKPTIKTRHLTKIYPNGTCAVNNVSFDVCSDEMTIILGPSGAGKSTLLRCLNRLVEPTSGHIELNGKDITHFNGGFGLQEVRKRVGMIFQQFNLVRRLTVLENVLSGRLSHCRNIFWRLASLSKMFSKPEKDFAFECLKKVRIEHLAFQRADTLSGGQQQRVAIARTLAQEPYVFLADEPVASLDPASSEIVMDTLQEIHETQKIPVIINLHQIELAERYATRLVGMAEGRLVFDGSGSDLSSDIVEKIYGMQVNRTANYRSRRQAIHQNDTRPDEFETEANTIALFKNEKMSTRLKRRSQAL
jgi:phosphonate transport system ATP-binding protein